MPPRPARPGARAAMLADMLVLVVEDDPAVRSSLERSLTFEGYDVVTAQDGAAGLDAVTTHRPDAVLLDLGLPDLDGVEICRRMRAGGDHTPVLMLTARDATCARVLGLDAGADDYLPKPFALEELLARVRVIGRRREVRPPDVDVGPVAREVGPAARTTGSPPEALLVEDLTLDPGTRVVTRGGREVLLTRTEFELLELFVRHPRQVLNRAQILRQVWGFDFDPGSNTLEVYVGYLRRKLEAAGEPRVLHTVWGVGYVLKPAAPARG